MSSILKVSEIQDPTNGNTALSVGSDGFVVLPQSPKIYALFRNTANVTADGDITAWEVPDTGITANNIGDAFTHSSGVWTFPRTGVYRVIATAAIENASGDNVAAVILQTTSDSGSNYVTIAYQAVGSNGSNKEYGNICLTALVNITNTSTQKLKMGARSIASGSYVYGRTEHSRTTISFEWMAPPQ